MDELALCERVLRTVLHRAHGRQVMVVRIRLGVLHRGSVRDVRWTFGLLAAGTVAAGARLEVAEVAVRARCASCGFEVESQEVVARCTACGSSVMRIHGGDDIGLESISLAPD